jgi:purine-binding chemotaxis protein CheW
MAHFLICRLDQRVAAIAADQVEETLRPLPLERIPESPPWVAGLSLIRGLAVPVVDPMYLLQDQPLGRLERLITVKLGTARRVAVQASEVLGLKDLDIESLSQLPPLAAQAQGRGLASLKVLDPELLSILEGSRLFPEDLWLKVEESGDAGHV